jgi:GH35 family endo-1,4-beta-xylanase
MFQDTLDIFRQGVIVCSFPIDEKTIYKEQLMTEKNIICQTISFRPLPIAINDYILHDGEMFTIEDQWGTAERDGLLFYSIVFESEMSKLLRKKIKDERGRKKFSYYGDARNYLQLFINNVNKISPGFTIGRVDLGPEQHIEFDGDNCRSGLFKAVEAFKLEFYNEGKVLHMVKQVGRDLDVTFEQGMGNGLYELELQTLDNTGIVTRLWGYGGTQNIAPSYRENLGQLMFGAGYIDRNTEIYGVREDDFTDETIFPKRTGSVTSTSSLLSFVDETINFDLNDCFLEDNEATVSIKTGDLTGVDLKIKRYDHATKTVSLEALTDGDYTLPSATRKLQIGNEYVFLGIKLPDAYVNDAETNLYVATDQASSEYAIPRVSYGLAIDEKFVRDNEIYLKIGDRPFIKSTRLGINNRLRTTAIEYPLVNRANIKATVGNVVVYQAIDKLAIESKKNARAIKQVANQVSNVKPVLGAFLSFKGPYDSTVNYYGGKDRVEVVKYEDNFYHTKINSGTFKGYTPTNPLKWKMFEGQFESLATGLLLAELAYIENLGVRYLSTDEVGKKRAELNGVLNNFRLYEAGEKVLLEADDDSVWEGIRLRPNDNGVPTIEYIYGAGYRVGRLGERSGTYGRKSMVLTDGDGYMKHFIGSGIGTDEGSVRHDVKQGLTLDNVIYRPGGVTLVNGVWEGPVTKTIQVFADMMNGQKYLTWEEVSPITVKIPLRDDQSSTPPGGGGTVDPPVEPEEPADAPVTLPPPSTYSVFAQNVQTDGGTVNEDMFSRQFEAQNSIVKTEANMLLIPNATKPGFIYAINTGNGNAVPLTFERAGTGTYFDKDGFMKVAEVGTPRIQYDPLTKALRGYLRERESTNQFLRSETFASPAWGTALTVLKANTTPSVKAGSTMKELAETNSSGEHRIMQAVTVMAGETRFFSFYLKTGVLSRNAYIQLNGNNSSGGPIAASVAYFNLTTGVATLKTTNLINGFTNLSCSTIPSGNGIYRCVFSVTVPVNVVSIACYLGTAISTAAASDNRSFAGSTGSILLDCAQAEKTALSSYVTTLDVPVTRPADVIGQINLLSTQTLYTNVNGVKSFQLVNAGALDIPYGNIKALALFTRELTQVEKDTIVNGASTLKGNGFPLGFMTKRGSLASAIEVPIIQGHGVSITPENDGKTPNKLKTDDNSNNYEFLIPQLQFAKDNNLGYDWHLGWWPTKEPPVMVDFFTNPNTTVEQAEAMFKWMMQAPLRYVRNHPTLSGTVKRFDAINEPFNEGPVINSTGQIWKPNVILDKLGPGVYKRGIQYAKEADPRADILINEYGPEYRWLKLDAMVGFANECKAEGIPLDGFGLQFHQQASVDMNNVRLGLRTLASTGLKIRYSEVAISMLYMEGSETNLTPAMEEAHAAAYVELMNIFWTEVSPQQRLDFMTWGTIHSAYMGPDVNEHAMLFKDDGTPTLAYTRMIAEMLRLNSL